MSKQPAKKRRRIGGRAQRTGYGVPYHRRRKLNPSELKFFDSDQDDAVITNTWAGYGTVIGIGQGVTDVTRVGRKVTIKKVMWRWTVTLPDTTAATATRDTVRLVCYQDKQANAAIASTATMWASDNYHTFRNLENIGRYKILYDKTIDLNSQSGGSSAAGVHQFGADSESGAFYTDCSIPIQYSGATGAIGEITVNNIGIVAISKNGLAGMDSKVRIRYDDR